MPVVSREQWLAGRVRFFCWCFGAAFGLIQALASRHAMQVDGISYLDMGDAIVRGDWNMGVNGYWSPLYSGLQGLALKLVHPAPYWQFTVVHLVNFLIYLFTFACFDFLLGGLVPDPNQTGKSAVPGWLLPKWALLAIAYSFFIYCSLTLVTMERVSPDMLMAGFVCLAAGLMARIRRGSPKMSAFALLGAVLGLGYLAKAPLFPLSLVFFGISFFVAGNFRRAVPLVVVEVLAFLAIASPWAIALSRAKHRLTFGDSGKVNYILFVNGAQPSWYFQTLGTAHGRYLHPIRKLFENPPVYEFATPLKGTQPIWYDASYWTEGATPHIGLRLEFFVVRTNIETYLHMVFSQQGALFAGFVLLCFVGGPEQTLGNLIAQWPVWLVGLAGLGMYALIHIEPRYVAVFFVLLWAGLFSGIRLPERPEWRRLVPILTLVMVISLAVPVAISSANELISVVARRPNNVGWQVAEELTRMGVRPGDRVARIGGFFSADYARLLGLTVVAEVSRADAERFWSAQPEVQAQVTQVFRSLEVAAVVAQEVPPFEVFEHPPGWRKIGDHFYVMKLQP